MATIAELDPILPRLKDSSNLVEGKRLLHPASRDISPQQLVLARRLMATNEAGTSVYLTRREIERLCLGGQIEFYDKPGYEPKEKGYLISGITN